MLEIPFLEIALALVGFQLIVFLYLYYRHQNTERSGSGSATATGMTAPMAGEGESETTDPQTGGQEVVTCADCGAENDPGYRYCRRCISDLSVDSAPGSHGRSPTGRLF